MSRNQLVPSARAAAARYDGFTLVELMWVMALSLVIFGAVLFALMTAFRQTTDNVDQVSANDAITRTLERVTREIRDATYVSAPSSDGTKITLHEYVPSTGSSPATLDTIKWDCSGQDSNGHYLCTRQDVTAGTTAKEISGLTVADVFRPVAPLSGSYAPVTIWLQQAIPGSDDLVLTEEVTPRNCLYGTPCDNG